MPSERNVSAAAARYWAAWRTYLTEPVPAAPLAVFRILFGAMMVFGTLRFWWLGWIDDHFIDTRFTFKYFGFHWVTLPPPALTYALHALMLAGALGIMLGWYYRWAAALFFATFTYVELIDLTYYLNHYYFVSLAAGWLVFTPAHRRASLDVYFGRVARAKLAPRWTVLVFKFQIAVVYVYAGLAKINADWLLHALPLRIWLPAHTHLPVLGPWLALPATAYLFSWLGMLYDCTIVAWLSWRPTRALAYLSVVVFHSLTGLLFQIGIFPLVMMVATWIYFSPRFHERLLRRLEGMWKTFFGRAPAAPWQWPGRRGGVATLRRSLSLSPLLSGLRPGAGGVRPLGGAAAPHRSRGEPGSPFTLLRASDNEPGAAATGMEAVWPIPHGGRGHKSGQPGRAPKARGAQKNLLPAVLTIYIVFQLLFPWRYLLYPGNLFWTEEGYRFGWRVMLMEKAGTATFYVRDPATGREGAVDNAEWLRPHQEKQMAMQPDMLLQYAHFLARQYQQPGQPRPAVRAEVYVTLNGRPSQLLIDPQLDLAAVRDGWAPKTWIMPSP